MKVVIAAIGRAKASPELQLYHDYIKRIPYAVECREFDIKHSDIAQRKIKEGEQLLAACKGAHRIVALDETGRQHSSREFAEQLKDWQGQGHSSYTFIIGGADGLDKPVRQAAHMLWSFGRVTWPHMMVRAMLAEQLYRAHTINSGHPYHK